MVVFTCNHCGDSLRKPKVAIHYQQICRNAPFLTCVDCLKDFRDDEYVAHTKCITEAERYGAKDYVPKPGANKGERKQQEWINVVNDLLNGTVELSKVEQNFLNTLSKYENIPRKKAKFLNFVHNAIGNRVNMTVVESVWNKMENAHKQSQQVATKTPEESSIQNQEQNKDEMTCTQNMDSNISFDNQNLAENQNNENICKENNSASHQSGSDEAYGMINGHLHERQSKSKKRKLESISIQSEEDQTAKISKKKKKKSSSDNGSDVATFHWKKTILDILQVKAEIALKKLRHKVIKKYICYMQNIYATFSLNKDINIFKLTEYAKAIAKFDKTVEKLKKSSTVCISENKIKLL